MQPAAASRSDQRHYYAVAEPASFARCARKPDVPSCFGDRGRAVRSNRAARRAARGRALLRSVVGSEEKSGPGMAVLPTSSRPGRNSRLPEAAAGERRGTRRSDTSSRCAATASAARVRASCGGPTASHRIMTRRSSRRFRRDAPLSLCPTATLVEETRHGMRPAALDEWVARERAWSAAGCPPISSAWPPPRKKPRNRASHSST